MTKKLESSFLEVIDKFRIYVIVMYLRFEICDLKLLRVTPSDESVYANL